jgi:hypothetical protein
MTLTDKAIRNLKPKDTPYKKSDGEGLHLRVMPEGSKLRRLAYRFAGKQKTMALGSYPVVTLAMAREFKAEAKRLLAQGVDPSAKRKADKRAAAAARTFGEVADEWFDTKREPEEKSEATLERDRWLKGEWNSEIGHHPIGEIEPPELLGALTVVIGIHPFVIGTPDGAAALRRVLSRLKKDDKVWLTDTEAILKAVDMK